MFDNVLGMRGLKRSLSNLSLTSTKRIKAELTALDPKIPAQKSLIQPEATYISQPSFDYGVKEFKVGRKPPPVPPLLPTTNESTPRSKLGKKSLKRISLLLRPKPVGRPRTYNIVRIPEPEVEPDPETELDGEVGALLYFLGDGHSVSEVKALFRHISSM